MKLVLIIISILLFLTGCKSDVEKPFIDSSKVIRSAKVIEYDDLNSSEKERLMYGCSCFPNNWHDGVAFSKEKAFFVRAQIDNKLLAELTESETFQIKDLLSENIYMLYGKYKTRWEFKDSDGYIICETNKFDGHSIISINRFGEVDDLIIGPLISKPISMAILIVDSKYYKDNLNPEFKIR